MKKIIFYLGLSIAMLSVSISAEASSISDVSEKHPKYTEINYSLENKFMTTNNQFEFQPEKTITRKEIAVILGQSMRINDNVKYEEIFTDVKRKDEAINYIIALTNKGLFSKNSEKNFYPNEEITEAQLSKLLVVGFNLESSKKSNVNIDSKHWAYEYYNVLVSLGIMDKTKISKSTLNNHVTKEQLSHYLYEIDKLRKTEFKHKYVTTEQGIELMSPNSIEHYIQYAEVEPTSGKNILVKNKEELKEELLTIYKDLPDKVYIQGVKIQEVNEVLDEITEKVHPKDSINIMTLANYNVSKSGNRILLSDNANNFYSAKKIEAGVKQFSKEFASKLEGLDDFEKLNVIYNYIFENFKYNAQGIRFMMVGNSYTGEFACNGYSRLFYELASASALNAEIVKGLDHFWNRVTINGEIINVDITTDDYLNKKFYTLGSLPDEHIKKTSETEFYSSEFHKSLYSEIKPLSTETLNKIKNMK